MTDKHLFKAQKRTILGKKVNQLRKTGVGVGSISTPSGKSISIQYPSNKMVKLLNASGESTLIYISIEDEAKERPVLIEEIQYNTLTQDLEHVAFRQVSLKQKVSAAIPIEIVGEIDIPDATLVVVMDEVELEALPTDLPEKLEVDVTKLTEIGQSISLADLTFDRSKLTLVLGEDQDPATTPIVMVQAIKTEAEEAEETEAAVATEVATPDAAPVATTETETK